MAMTVVFCIVQAQCCLGSRGKIETTLIVFAVQDPRRVATHAMMQRTARWAIGLYFVA